MSYMFRKSTPLLTSAVLGALAFNVGAWQPADAQSGTRVAFGGGNPSASTAPVQGTGAAGQNPRAVSLYNLGLTAFRQGSPESAIIFFKRACDIDPNLADAQYNLAVIYQSQKRFRDAIPRYEEVLRLKPSDPDAHYQIGVILFDMGRFSEARPHFNAIAPNNVHFSDSQRRLATMNQAQPSTASGTNYGTTFDAPPVATGQPNPGPGYQPQQSPSTPPAVTPPTYNAPQARSPIETAPPSAVSSQYGSSNYGSNPPTAAQNDYNQPPTYGRDVSSQPPAYGQSATQGPAYGQQPASNYPSQQPGYVAQPPAQTGQIAQSPPSTGATYLPTYQAPTAAPAPTSGNPVAALPNTTLRVIATGFNAPAGLAFDRAGNLYVANFMTNSVDRIAPDGSRTQFSSGVNLRGPIGLAVDEIGNLYVANYNNGTVARINPAGVSTVIAQNLRKPYYLTLDRDGNLYVSQQEDNSIVRISLPRQQASSKPQ